MWLRHRFVLGLLCSGFLGMPFFSVAAPANYPAGPVSLVVPFSPGGGTDFVARAFANSLSSTLGDTVVVRNQGGAGTTIGTGFVARSAPNGQTLLLSGSTMTYLPAMYKSLTFDVKKDLTPVAFVSDQPYALLVNKDFPASSLSDLIAQAKQSPGQIPYGSAGIGSAMHLSAAMLWQKAGIDLLHVPYPGTGQAMNDLIAGRIKVVYTTAAGAMGMIKAGTVKALAVSSARRLSVLPDIPTLSEAGLNGFTQGSWLAVFAPGKTPPGTINKISDAVHRALSDPHLVQQMESQGLEIKTGTPAQIKTFFDNEIDRWTAVIQAAGIKPQ